MAMGPSKGSDCRVTQALVKAFSAIITGIHSGDTQNVAGIGPWNVDSTICISGTHIHGDAH